jgi:hypothetical protein
MMAIDYMVLFLLMAVILFAMIYFTVGIPWFKTGGYGEMMACCDRFRINDCADPSSVKCDGDYLDSLLIEQNITLSQIKTMCSCGQK